MVRQRCPKCRWLQEENDKEIYRFCPKCNFDSQDHPTYADILPFEHPLNIKKGE